MTRSLMAVTATDVVVEMERVVQRAPGRDELTSDGLISDGLISDGHISDGLISDGTGNFESSNGPFQEGPSSNSRSWAGLVNDLVSSNLRQWDLEDTTRDPGASDSIVANAKRQIDKLNIGRHRLVQAIDAAIDSTVDQSTTAPIATESPGMVLDRLSVLVIRRARTAAAASHHPAYAERVPALDSQLAALSLAFDAYMDELRTGTKRFIPYAHHKLYRPSPSSPPNLAPAD
jgi:Protein of unknown function (DUF4254)